MNPADQAWLMRMFIKAASTTPSMGGAPKPPMGGGGRPGGQRRSMFGGAAAGGAMSQGMGFTVGLPGHGRILPPVISIPNQAQQQQQAVPAPITSPRPPRAG